MIVAGKVSTFTPADAPNITADGKHTAADPGIALWGHSDTLGRHYCVTLRRGRLHAVLKHIDIGPAPWTGREIDVTGAGVSKLGGLQTDEPGKARLLPRHRGPEWRCGRR